MGRNYLQVGFYTEVLFPQKNVRFLAINNSIDSNNASDNDFAPFLNIMNEWYAKDTSNKIKAIFDARMKDGKRCSGSIPYGYNRLPSDKQTLVVDPVASEVVKRIFTLANDGKSTRAIAEILTEEKVLTPAAYAKEYHPEQYNGNKFTNPYLWAMSTIRNILGRQEYLGHTVLRKSVSTNFKLHKRKSTDEEEQYVFPNTHEPIISQELWDSVQKRRSRVNRASAWGTHSNRLSGYLYCADCGRRMTLQTHYSKKDGSVQYSYRCGGYASRVNSCTSHSISTDNVEALILSSVKRFSRFVLNDEQAFALELQSLWNEKQEEKPKHNQSELQRCQKRYDELSTLVRGLYENLMSGLLPERQYKQLMKERLEQLQKHIQREQIKYEPAHNVSKTYNEIDSMGQKTITGKMAISKEDYSQLTALAKEGITSRAEINELKQSANYYRQKYFDCANALERMKTKYNELKEKCRPFLQALEHFPEVAKLFTEKVKQLFSFKEAQERAEKEAREKERQERIKARRSKRGMER